LKNGARPKTAVIVPSAGAGVRMGGEVKKQFLTIEGKPVLAWTLSALASSDFVDEIIVAAPQDEIEFVQREIVGKYGIQKVKAVVAGGATRQESVAKGFAAVSDDAGIVMTHDGVRPFVSAEIIEACVKLAVEHGAAAAAIPVKDTLRKTENGLFGETVNREGVVRLQTPQAFRRAILGNAIEAAYRDGYAGTDESTLAERIGSAVHVSLGSETNIKITTAEDLILAEAFIRAHLFRSK